MWLATGAIARSAGLVSVPTTGVGFNFRITNHSQETEGGSLGPGWRHDHQFKLDIGSTLVTFISGGGQHIDFIADGLGGWEIDTTTSIHYSHRLTNPSGTLWELQSLPDKTILRFEGTALAGQPQTAGRLIEIEDRSGNVVSLHYSGAGKLTSIEDPQGREILLAYTGELLTSVSDPKAQTTVLTYDLQDRLESISSPEGCTVSFSYEEDLEHLITTITDARGDVTRYSYLGDRIESVLFPNGELLQYTYNHDDQAPIENVSDYNDDQPFNATLVTFASDETYEYRFDKMRNLWRVISPSGHIKRYFWSRQQKFLYASEGYALFKDGLYGPTDNYFNRITSHSVNALGHTTEIVDPTGVIDTFTVDDEGRVLVAHPGQVHQGVQGDWPPYYGSEGVVLCAFNSDSSDVFRAPDYLDSDIAVAITNGDGSSGNAFVRANYNTIKILDPRAPVEGADDLNRGIGHWKQTGSNALGSKFEFAINLNENKAFNLSLYTHSADHSVMGVSPLKYYEQFGRDVIIEVEDLSGVQSYRVPNNAPGIWVTFPVEADTLTPIRVTVTASGQNNQPVLSAIAFDPHHDRRTFYEYTNGNLTKVRNGLGHETSWIYNSDGTQASFTDARGKTTSYAYLDAGKNLTRITDADSNVTELEYDENGNVTKMTDANLHVTEMTYDGKNRLLTTTDPLLNVTAIDYDGNGNVLTLTDPKLRVTTFGYAPGNKLISVEDALGQRVEMSYDGDGRLSSQTDARGFVTHYRYDNEGKLAAVETPDGQKTTFSYDAINQLVALTGPNGNQEKMELINLVGAGNLLLNPGFEKDDLNFPGGADHWKRDDGSHVRETNHVYKGSAGLSLPNNELAWKQTDLFLPEGAKFVATAQVKRSPQNVAVTARVRDFSGQEVDLSNSQPLDDSTLDWTRLYPLTFEVPGDAQTTPSHPTLVSLGINVVSEGTVAGWLDEAELYMLSQAYKYDYAGRLKSTSNPDGSKVTLHRDRLNRVIAVEDPLGLRTQMTLDVLDRPVTITKSNGETLSFVYNEVGALTSFKDGKGQVTLFEYDDLNRLTTITYPDLTEEAFVYDGVGNLTSYEDNKGQVRLFAYDELNRLETITYPDTTTITMAYDEVGNLLSMIERNGDIVSYAYDDLDRIAAVTRTADSGNTTPEWHYSYTYDESGNPISTNGLTGDLWTVSGPEARYGTGRYGTARYSVNYDAMNRPVGIEKDGSQKLAFVYDNEGRRVRTDYVNGLLTTANYDIAGRLMDLNVKDGDFSMLSMAYEYDANSQRTSQVSGDTTFDYQIDDQGRLVGEAVNRMVESGQKDFSRGLCQGVTATAEGLKLLTLSDDLSGSEIDCDRWQISFRLDDNPSKDPDPFIGYEVRQNNGLHHVFPRGYSNRVAYRDDLHPLKDDFGTINERIRTLATHRVPLIGDFDISTDFEDFQTYDLSYYTATCLGVSQHPTTLNVGWYTLMCSTRANSSFIESSVGNSFYAGPIDSSGRLRITRVGSTITCYCWNAGTSSWTAVGNGGQYAGPAWVTLTSRADPNTCYSTTFRNFIYSPSALYSSSSTYESVVYDAGRNVVWGNLSWKQTLPIGTGIKLQLAHSSSAEGPWTYVGPDGTPGSYFETSTGEAVGALVIGRYCRYRATLLSDGTSTPTLERVELGFSGGVDSQYSSYAYDDAGNMTAKRMTSDSTTVFESRTFNSLNQLTQNAIDDGGVPVTWDFTYDLNGNLTFKTDGTDTTTYLWNEDNRLLGVELNSVAVVSYVYDSASRLLQRAEGGTITNYHWDGWDLVHEEKTGTITETTDYLVYGGQVLAFERDGVTFYPHGDALSSTQLVTDENGAQVGRFIYGAWGEELLASETIPGLFDNRFVGGLGVRNDSATGLIYMRHRWYDCELQRFISRDPIGLVGGANLYSYVGNRPYGYVDPTGLKDPATPMPKGTPSAPCFQGETVMDYAKKIQQSLKGWYNSQGYGLGPPTQQYFNGRRRQDYIKDVNEGRIAPYPIFVAYDKFKHCYLSCVLAGGVGGGLAFMIGAVHEYVNQGYDEKDFIANDYGIQISDSCPQDCSFKERETSCMTKCNERYPFVFLWPRYPG